MKKSAIAVLLAASLSAPLTLAGASPLSITYTGDMEAASGSTYETYDVKCSNNKIHTMSKWEQDAQWCVGEPSAATCTSKKVRAAKMACKQK